MKAITIFGAAALATSLFTGIALSAGSDTPTLIDTQWTLTVLNGSETPRGVSSTLRFGEDAVGGNGGCNTYGGSVAFQGKDGLDISRVFSTMMACEPVKLDQERAFFDALEAATHYALNDETLTLLGQGSAALAVFVPASD